ncbi:MAG: EamA family transporter [Bacteroidota bacterium]
MKNPSKLVIWFSVMLLSLIWGSTWLAIKIGLYDTPPIFSAALRFIVASAFLIFYMKIKKIKFPVTLQYWKYSLFMALFMFMLPYGFVYWGEKYVSSGLSAVIFSSQSLFVIIFSQFFLKHEKATLLKIAGLFIGTLGLIYIFYSRFEIAENYGLFGMAGILLAAVSAAFALVWLRMKGDKSDLITDLTSQICITALFFILTSLCFEKFPADISSPNLWLSVGYLAVIGTSISFLIYYWLAKHTSALILSFSIYLTPVLALFLGWFFLDEGIGTNDIIGTIIVITSIIIAQSNKKLSFLPIFTIKLFNADRETPVFEKLEYD